MFCVCVLMLWEPRTIIELESIKQNEICKYSINLVHLAISGRIRWIDGGFNFHSSHWRDGISDDANRYRKKMEIMTFGWAVEIKHIYLHELSSFFTLPPPPPLFLSLVSRIRGKFDIMQSRAEFSVHAQFRRNLILGLLLCLFCLFS